MSSHFLLLSVCDFFFFSYCELLFHQFTSIWIDLGKPLKIQHQITVQITQRHALHRGTKLTAHHNTPQTLKIECAQYVYVYMPDIIDMENQSALKVKDVMYSKIEG